MRKYQNDMEEHGWKKINTSKYSKLGETYAYSGNDFEGLYWIYETDRFIIDIHDLFNHEERVVNSNDSVRGEYSFYSSYILTGNGEAFNPYASLTSNSVYFTNNTKRGSIFILHANFPYLSVGINFKEEMLKGKLEGFNMEEMFFDTREEITKPLADIARSIINCQKEGSAAELFFDAKASEWLSITLEAYLSQTKVKPLSRDDEKSIEAVASYINDHYALDIPQEILESIAMMSGTKLKKLFKQKYQMSITEYSQRKRMNIAETLLLSTNLEIKDIAKSVGYSSHSKFTNYYKKYKGMYPKDVKKLAIDQGLIENDDE